MKLSVIIPVYNMESTLSECLDSVLRDQHRDMEVIVVDDGSTDGSGDIARKYAETHENVTVVSKRNGGLSDARNSGLAVATGECITFIDSDDTIAPHTYDRLMAIMESDTNCDMLEYPVSWRHGSNDQRTMSLGNATYTNPLKYWFTTAAYRHTYAWNKIYRRKLFAEVTFPIGRAFEDAFTLPLLIKECKKIVTTDKGLYHYKLNREGITQNAGAKEYADLLEAHRRMFALGVDRNFYAATIDIALQYYNLTGIVPQLPRRRYLTTPKLFLLSTIGMSRLCRLNKWLGTVMRRRG